MVILEEDEVARLVDRAQAFEAIRAVFRANAAKKADVSHPSALHLRALEGLVYKVKGAVVDHLGAIGFRLVGDFDNPKGAIRAYHYIADARTAEPLALVAEVGLHRVRTAVTGLVACRALARAEPARLALVGTGRIAEEVIRCMDFVFPDAGIILASRSVERARAAARRWGGLRQRELEWAPSVASAVARADIALTVSDASERLFAADDLRPGTIVCGMGGGHEFDADVLRAADAFVIDEFDFVCTAGNGAHWLASGQIDKERLSARVSATIGELLLGAKRIDATGTILAIIQGMAICDLALAKMVYDRAMAQRSLAATDARIQS